MHSKSLLVKMRGKKISWVIRYLYHLYNLPYHDMDIIMGVTFLGHYKKGYVLAKI